MNSIKLSLKKSLRALFIGSIVYQVIMILFLQLNQKVALFLSIDLFALIFVAAGIYTSFSQKSEMWPNIIISFLLISGSHYIFYNHLFISTNLKIEYDIFSILMRVGICAYIGGTLKFQSIIAKENKPSSKTPQEIFEDAKNYRMNPYIRPLGVIVGFLFVLMPF